MLLAKSFLAFLIGILLSYCLTPLAGRKLHDRCSNHLNVMVYKSLTCKLPTNLCNIFNHVHETHSHLTRVCFQGNLVPPRCKNNSDKRKFTYRGSTSFNDLPTTAKSPFHQVLALSNIFYPNNSFWWFLPYVQFLLFLNIFLYL